MDDAELQRIRASRLAELQSQSQSQSQSSSSRGPAGQATGSRTDVANADPDAEANQRHAMLSQILDSSARDRLRRIALVKPDRARGVEDLLIRMQRAGQIRQRVTEGELVGLLEEIAAQQQAERETVGKIRHLRRSGDESEDDWA